MLAWLDGDEPAADTVEHAFAAGRPWMSWLNIGEVAYRGSDGEIRTATPAELLPDTWDF